MIAKTFLAALGVMAASTLAHADAIPSFLSDGQKYVTDIKACTAEVVEETDILQLTKDGVFGYEYGCNFVQFMDVRDVGDGKVYQYLAKGEIPPPTEKNPDAPPELVELVMAKGARVRFASERCAS